MAYNFIFLCSAMALFFYLQVAWQNVLVFILGFVKELFLFPFKLVNLIAVCQFCKLDSCVLLRKEIKGKAGGSRSFGCDRMNSSQRTVLTSAAARAQWEPAACSGMGSQELGVPCAGCVLTGRTQCWSEDLPAALHMAVSQVQTIPVRSSRWWDRRQGQAKVYTLGRACGSSQVRLVKEPISAHQ